MRARSVVIAVLLLSLSGCGSGGSEDNARRSVQRFLEALERHDGEAACRQLAPETASAVAEDEKKPCGEAVLSLGIGTAPIRRVHVYVDAAQARLEGGGAVFLDETSAGWRVSAAGCKPQPGKPYDCELEA
jgi:hypothetical protein